MQAATMEIRPISITEMHEHAQALLVAHWQEVGQEKHRRVLSPDWTRYYEAEEKNVLLAIGAWVDGELAGYSLNFVAYNMHYSEVLSCQNDLLFVDEKHRRGSLGGRLIKATERAAKNCGAHEMLWHAKPDTVLNDGLPKLGYSVLDIIHCKEL